MCVYVCGMCVCVFVGCCLATKTLNLINTKQNGWRWQWVWQWVARGNIQQISYIPKTEQHSPFGLMECHYYVCLCVCVCVHVCVYVLCVCVCACVCACACVCVWTLACVILP